MYFRINSTKTSTKHFILCREHITQHVYNVLGVKQQHVGIGSLGIFTHINTTLSRMMQILMNSTEHVTTQVCYVVRVQHKFRVGLNPYVANTVKHVLVLKLIHKSLSGQR